MEEQEKLHELPLNEVWADPEFNSRGAFTPASVVALSEDIQRQGLMQPIVVQNLANPALGTKFKIVVGHRRYAAYKLLVRTDPKFSAITARVISRPLPEGEARVMNIKENLEREPLNMLQEARSLNWFKHQGWDAKYVAARLGQTKKWVEVRFGLLGLPEDIQHRAEAGYLTQYQVQECMDLPTSDEQYAYVKRIVDHKEGEKRIPTEDSRKKKLLKKRISLFSQGEPRSQADMFVLQESIQDSFNDNKHPAAVALAWAAGVISYDDFVKQIRQWAADEGVTYVEHELVKESA